MVGTVQEETGQHRARAGLEQEKGWAPQGRAGQDGGGQVREPDGAGQHGQCYRAQGKSRQGQGKCVCVCACKSVRLREFAKLVCFELVVGGAAFPSSSFGVVLLFPSLGGAVSLLSLGMCCFLTRLWLALILPCLLGGCFLLPSLLSVVVLFFNKQITPN